MAASSTRHESAVCPFRSQGLLPTPHQKPTHSRITVRRTLSRPPTPASSEVRPVSLSDRCLGISAYLCCIRRVSRCGGT